MNPPLLQHNKVDLFFAIWGRVYFLGVDFHVIVFFFFLIEYNMYPLYGDDGLFFHVVLGAGPVSTEKK